VSLLIALGLISFTVYSAVHWTERQLLTTDNWVAMVTPLPKNDTVATALSNYTVQQVFTATDLNDRIKEALPDRAAFLVPVLTAQLQDRLDNRTKQFIQSDQFSTLWQSANRRANERLLASAREESSSDRDRKLPVNIDLDLGGLRDRIRGVLGSDQEAAASAPAKVAKVGLAVNLKTSLEKVKSYIRAVDFLNGTVGFLSLVCFVGAIVITRHRRRIVMVISACLAVVATLQLIGVKALEPYVLSQVHDDANRPAVEVVYNTLLTSFHRNATVVLVVSLIVLFIAYLWSRSVIERNMRLKRWLRTAERSPARQKYTEFRGLVRTYLVWIIAAAIFFWLLLMAFVLNFDTQGLVRAILSMLLTVEVISLVAARSRSEPMKH
jgi:hypothetical protein